MSELIDHGSAALLPLYADRARQMRERLLHPLNRDGWWLLDASPLHNQGSGRLDCEEAACRRPAADERIRAGWQDDARRGKDDMKDAMA
ncbi:MAG: hypothetical protein MRY63_11570 [Neomegalonema sp.]|nr:hypothetical protein [Neomegalonema sp.]